jgi:hypothetical protein
MEQSKNTLNKEELGELEDLAGATLNNDDLEIVMRLPKGFLREAISSGLPEGLAVLRGRIKTKAMHRKAVVQLAMAGSGPAQAMVEQFIVQQQIDDM